MPPKGTTNNPAGRPKGSANKATGELRSRISDFLANRWEQVESDFDALPAKDRMHFFEKLLSYALPKLESVEYVPALDKMLDGLSDAQLDHLIEQLNQRLDHATEP